MSDIFKRTITGIVFVLILVSGTLLHPFSFAILYGLISFFALHEFLNLTVKTGFSAIKIVAEISGVAVFVLAFLISYYQLPQQYFFLFLPLYLIVFITGLYNKQHDSFLVSALVALGLFYISIPFSLTNFIVFSGENGTFYPWVLTGIFIIIWIFDSMAYVFGSWLGKHRLFESISPKKSWEGFIGGAVFALVAGVVNAVLFPQVSLAGWIIISVIIIVFGTYGDLFESKIKRGLEIKDSGTILPGHGGLLDRFDSFLFAIPVIYLWLLLGHSI